MPSLTTSPAYRAYRAPQSDGGVVVDPPLDGFRLERSIATSQQAEIDIAGSPLSRLQSRARRELLDSAIAFTGVYREVPEIDRNAPIVMAGHQPELFHAGVWFKNFVLSRLAKSLGVVPLNLIVDNDQNRSPSIRVPARVGKRFVWKRVMLDTAPPGIPYEQQQITDRDLFDSFPQRVSKLVESIEPDPLVHRLWQFARQSADRCGNMACTLAQARHQLEAAHGLETLEIPLSILSRSRSFLAFTLALIGQLPRFQTCYNDSAADYRRAHHIRSTSHPVPDLAEDDGWLEAPFWLYSDAAPQRRPVWVKQTGKGLHITDREGVNVCLSSPFDTPEAIDELANQLAACGTKLRPRALVTTMYTRLVLCDLFLHGIGGGKYDQLTDRIIHAFFGITPPPFSVVSATIRLNAAHDVDLAAPERLEEVRRSRRDLRFNPERIADRDELPPELIAKKQSLLQAIPPRGQKRDWHEQMVSVNRALYQQAERTRRALDAEYEQAFQDAASAAVLRSREHAFCIFPEKNLIPRLQTLAEQVVP